MILYETLIQRQIQFCYIPFCQLAKATKTVYWNLLTTPALNHKRINLDSLPKTLYQYLHYVSELMEVTTEA